MLKNLIAKIGVALVNWATIGKVDNENAQQWAEAYALWEKVSGHWREDFIVNAKLFTKITGRGLNLGLIYVGQLDDPENYGSGLPLFWNSDYFQPSEDDKVAGVLAVKTGDACHVRTIEDLRSATLTLLRVRPADFIAKLTKV